MNAYSSYLIFAELILEAYWDLDRGKSHTVFVKEIPGWANKKPTQKKNTFAFFKVFNQKN